MAGCQSGASRVQGEILNHWAAETYNAGCYNPLSVLDDGHTPSAHAKGEAIDIGIKNQFRGRGSVGQQIFLWIHANRSRLQLTQLIWCGQIWSAGNHPNLIRPYTVNPHFDHIHVQFTPQAARNPALTALPFTGAGSADPGVKPPTLPEGADEMFRIIKGDDKGPAGQQFWLTNWLEKRKVTSIAESKAIITAGVTDGAQVVTWPQAFVDNIPVKS